LLAFSRRQVQEPKVINVNHLLTNLESLLRSLMGEHIRIETDFDTALSSIKADPHQIEQVIMNLAANARDAMPQGGQFQLQTRMAVPAGTQMALPQQGGDRVRIRISDNGCGMDSGTLERVFEPFFTTKGLGKGTGLGLSTVYGIVRQNEGNIHVSSEPGQGTTFEVYFPAVLGGQAESETPSRQAVEKRSHQTILLVEDHPAVRGMVRETLEQLGYTVLEATDGYEALRMVEKEPREIQLLLTDVIMPLMNGRELATRLRSIRPETKVLYMSGYTDEGLHSTESPTQRSVLFRSHLRILNWLQR
jgi:CheY-like chemotaxis protein